MFKSSINIYEYSKNYNLFINLLTENKISLSNEALVSITNFDIKKKAKKLYEFFLRKNVLVVPIYSKNYPKQLYNIDIPPLCIFIYGKIDILNKNIVYLYNRKFSKYGQKVYLDFSKYILSKNISLIGNNCSKEEITVNIKVFKEFKESTINEYLSKLSFEKVNIFLINEFNEIYEYYLLSSLAKFIVILEASYDDINKLKLIVDFAIEQGKDILVTPGNIYNKYAYFSNYLIKQGANILLSKHDIDSYI